MASDPRLTLRLFLRLAEASPVVRFRYAVRGDARLTKSAGRDAVTYLSLDMRSASDARDCRLYAYEHGSMPPYRFLEFALRPDRSAELRAVKGNYWSGYDLRQGYETLWFDVAAVRGGFDELAGAWREFVLRWMSPNPESRKPYIFYNTWNSHPHAR